MPSHDGLTCVVCCDEESKVVFSCMTLACEYSMCAECIKFAFEDGTGENSARCPSCHKKGNAVKMVAVVVGSVAVKAVENELRSFVEFDVNTRLEIQKVRSVELGALSEKARRIFNEMMEEMILKCPKCNAAFLDYTGCNALYCRCGCKFCAICLQDCGGDAHPHVRANHGNLFDTAKFESSKRDREKSVVHEWRKRIDAEPDGLKQLIKNHLEKAGILVQEIDAKVAENRTNTFLREAKKSLIFALRADRLSLLRDPSARIQRILDDDISPRFSVPDIYCLKLLKKKDNNVFEISLKMEDEEGKWVSVPIDEKENTTSEGKKPRPDVLVNLKYALKCAVVAIKGKCVLYQTRNVKFTCKGNDGGQPSEDNISVKFFRINSDGDAEKEEDNAIYGDLEIIGFNANLRINLMMAHVHSTDDAVLVSEPIKHLIGAGRSLPLLDELKAAVPDTIEDLNEQQKKLAHPLYFKSAVEVGGPPGTGKTKAITELTRSLLACTNYNIIVLSERNGAIDAIAEKFASNCLLLHANKFMGFTDFALWMNVLTFGASSVGKYTKMFTLEEKMKQHPELVRLREKQRDFAMALDILAKKQRKLLSGTVLSFGDVYRNDNMNAERQAQDIDRNNSKALGRPMDVIACVQNAIRLMPQLLSTTEDHFESVAIELNPLIGHIFPTRTKDEKKQAKPNSWNEFKGGMEAKCKEILLRFKIVLENSLFSVLDAEKLLMDWRESGLEFKRHKVLIRDALVNQATLRMSTIGSSHQLIVKNEKNDEPEPLARFSALSLKEDPNDRETVVIFDEAGCIPAYELLGISRLTSQVKSLVLVGDVHQLPPLTPVQDRAKREEARKRDPRGSIRRRTSRAFFRSVN